jgi:hypothetical protein
VAKFDPSVPSIARIYDYVLGGKDNFPADRAQADKALAYNPLIPVMARENRQFLSRAVGWVARQGIDQFIDIGCGLPTQPNTTSRPAPSALRRWWPTSTTTRWSSVT